MNEEPEYAGVLPSHHEVPAGCLGCAEREGRCYDQPALCRSYWARNTRKVHQRDTTVAQRAPVTA